MKIEFDLTRAEALALNRICETYKKEPNSMAAACLREWLLAEGRGRLTRAMTYRDQPVFEPITELPD